MYDLWLDDEPPPWILHLGGEVPAPPLLISGLPVNIVLRSLLTIDTPLVALN